MKKKQLKLLKETTKIINLIVQFVKLIFEVIKGLLTLF
jgi:hypothetical protein